MNMRETVQENPLLAIMRNVPLERTEDYVGAVIRGGVRFFEMAMITPHALEQIRLIRNSFGKKILVGAGTVLTAEAAEKAVESGARGMSAGYVKLLKGPFDNTEYVAIGAVGY